MRRLVFGCGYLGRRVADLWRTQGDEVQVVTRQSERAEELAAAGFRAQIADITRPETLPNLAEVETLLFAVGFDRSSGDTIEQVYVEGLRNVLAKLPQPPGKLIYISSTGVFGQVAGDWVDEDSPCAPTRAGGIACLAAEQVLQASPLADRTLILRLAGIYGPGRIPRASDIRAGRALDAASDGYLNLIHVEDAARIVVAAASDLAPPKLYVVSDGKPVVRRDYYTALARLLDGPPPRFVVPEENSPNAARAGSDKRIRPARLFAELPLALAYPSYREGLAAIVAEDRPG